MATKLTKPVVREITLKDADGVEGPVNITLTASGIELRAKGKQRKYYFTFTEVNKILTLPSTAPAKFTGNPLGWLVEGNDLPEKPSAPVAQSE